MLAYFFAYTPKSSPTILGGPSDARKLKKKTLRRSKHGPPKGRTIRQYDGSHIRMRPYQAFHLNGWNVANEAMLSDVSENSRKTNFRSDFLYSLRSPQYRGRWTRPIERRDVGHGRTTRAECSLFTPDGKMIRRVRVFLCTRSPRLCVVHDTRPCWARSSRTSGTHRPVRYEDDKHDFGRPSQKALRRPFPRERTRTTTPLHTHFDPTC